jgi:hypothetical protein
VVLARNAISLKHFPVCFSSFHFELVLSGHLMFRYAAVEEGGLMVGDGLDLDWHHAALIELCR